MERKFYICEHCGNIITKVKDSKVPVVCCGEKMKEIVAGTTDASLEKHVPIYKIDKNILIVNVGLVEHPMTEDHFIEFVYIQTNHGEQIKFLKPNQKPCVSFNLSENEIVENVFAFCNLHGMWKN